MQAAAGLDRTSRYNGEPLPPRALFIGFAESIWLDVVPRLAAERGWEPLYWSASADLEPAIRAALPGAIFHDVLAAARSRPPRELADLAPAPVDADLLAALAGHESQVLQQMDRMAVGAAFTYAERLELYHDYLGWWSAALDRLRPDLALFPYAPHLVYDFVLFLLCRARGIRTMLFDQPSFSTQLMLLEDGWEEGPPALNRLYAQSLARPDWRELTLSEPAEEALAKARGDYGAGMPLHLKLHLDKLKRGRAAAGWKSRLAGLAHPGRLAENLRRAREYVLAPPPPNYFKVAGRRLQDRAMTGLEWRRFKRDLLAQKRRLNRYYLERAENLPLDQPFIYVALHFQPERTSSPLGGVYVDQLLMIRLLSRLAPPGWQLYVREAPGQFFDHLNKQPARDRAFYDAILALPNARLASMEMDSFALIDHSRAVATLTGTVGWEAVLRDKPVLAFGFPWYLACEGVHYAGGRAGLERALAEIVSGRGVDHAKVRLFVHCLERAGVRAVINRRFLGLSLMDPAANAASLAAAMDAYWREGGGGR